MAEARRSCSSAGDEILVCASREDGMDALVFSRETGHSLEVPPRSVLRLPRRGRTEWSKAYPSNDGGGVGSHSHLPAAFDSSRTRRQKLVVVKKDGGRGDRPTDRPSSVRVRPAYRPDRRYGDRPACKVRGRETRPRESRPHASPGRQPRTPSPDIQLGRRGRAAETETETRGVNKTFKRRSCRSSSTDSLTRSSSSSRNGASSVRLSL